MFPDLQTENAILRAKLNNQYSFHLSIFEQIEGITSNQNSIRPYGDKINLNLQFKLRKLRNQLSDIDVHILLCGLSFTVWTYQEINISIINVNQHKLNSKPT